MCLKSVLNEIQKISGDDYVSVDLSNYNRYLVLTQGPGRAKTAYCFGVPIYNIKTGSLVDLCFNHNKNGSSYFQGLYENL